MLPARAGRPVALTTGRPLGHTFVTEQIDAWYSYLKSRGVGVLGEGHVPEFETFLEHEQNAKIRAALARGERP